MKNKVYYLLVVLSVLITACTRNITCPIRHFDGKPVKKLYPTKIIDLENFDVLRPINFTRLGDGVFVVQDLRNSNIFNLINLYSQEVMRGVSIGQGPGEFVQPPITLQYLNGRILAFDFVSTKIFEIVPSSDTTLVAQELYAIDTGTIPSLMRIHFLDSNSFIARGIFKDFWLAEMNTKGEILATIPYPSWAETRNIPWTALPQLHSKHVAHSPDGQRVVVAMGSHGLLSFLNRTESGVEEYKQIKYHPPLFHITERGGSAFSRDNVRGFVDVACDDNYIYALYSGRTINSYGAESGYGKHLLVYDWAGNPIRRYILDIPLLWRIYFDRERNRIYGIANNPEGVLVQYQLSGTKR